MGNYISCTLVGQGVTNNNNKKSSEAAKVIFPNGEIRNIYQHIKAAEVMLEEPSYFLVNSKSLQIGKRFNALNADEDLEIANVYVMFPMKRLNSLVSTSDLGKLFVTANSVSKRVSFGRVKILPEFSEEIETKFEEKKIELPKLDLDDIEDVEEIKQLLSMCRSRKPSLETIDEEPLSSTLEDEDYVLGTRRSKCTDQINSDSHPRKSLCELLALEATEDSVLKKCSTQYTDQINSDSHHKRLLCELFTLEAEQDLILKAQI